MSHPLSSKRRKLNEYSITSKDIEAILKYYIVDIPPYDNERKIYSKEAIYAKIKKACALLIIHSKIFVPPTANFFTVVDNVFSFYEKLYKVSISKRNDILQILLLEYNIAKLKYEFYNSNTTVKIEIHKFDNNLTYKQFTTKFISLLIYSCIHIDHNSSGIRSINYFLKTCFKYYYENVRHQFCGIFDDKKLEEFKDAEVLEDILYNNFCDTLNITNDKIIEMYGNVRLLPDCK